MTRPDVGAKCFDLMASVLGKTRARKLVDTAWNIEQVIDMRSLRPLLQARPAPYLSTNRSPLLGRSGKPNFNGVAYNMVPANRANVSIAPRVTSTGLLMRGIASPTVPTLLEEDGYIFS